MSTTAEVPREMSTASADIPTALMRDLRVSLERHSQRSEILHGINLEIRKGEILGVVGESGSGKSVLAMSLLGLLPPSARPQLTGELTVKGSSIVDAKKSTLQALRRSSLGVVFQDPMTSLNPTMPVGKQITEKSGSREESIRLMEAVGIPFPETRVDSFPHQLSGGLRQRVMIAMAVAGSPDLVIADEPTTALDVTVQAQVLELLADLRTRIGCSVMMITHDLGVAAKIADRIAVMHHGRIVEIGTAKDILENPQHPYTVGLLASRLTLRADPAVPLWSMPSDTTVFENRDDPSLQVLMQGARAALAIQREAHGIPEQPDFSDFEGRQQSIVQATELECVFRLKGTREGQKELRALDGVVLDVFAGESLAIVGESGSGKSTLLRIIGGLEKNHNDKITIPDSSEIQMVFQDAGSSLTPWLKVKELLFERLPRRMAKHDKRKKAGEILARVGLPLDVLDAKPSELSGGQRQRVALARATIVPPQVLLCDEPTSALDVSVAANVLNLINKLRRELGMAVVFVTHDLAVARIVSDRIAVMTKGQIVEVGPSDDIIFRPLHPYTQTLVRSVPQTEIDFLNSDRRKRGEQTTGECAIHQDCALARFGKSQRDKKPSLIPIEGGLPAGFRHEVVCVPRSELV